MTLSGRTANHPGEQLAERLEALELSAPELRRRLQVRVKRLGQIVTGQRAILGDTALRLARVFSTSPLASKSDSPLRLILMRVPAAFPQAIEALTRLQVPSTRRPHWVGFCNPRCTAG